MQISFDPLIEDEAAQVFAFIVGKYPQFTEVMDFMAREPAAESDSGPDQRDPAAVFGQSAAPLPLAALSTAAAGQLATAPAAAPASLPPLNGAGSPPAWVAPQQGAPSGNAAQTTPAGVDVDATGLPWDPRIHAGTKRKNADGSWTAKKGINDPALVARVTAELRAVQALPAPAASAAPAAAPAPAAPPQQAALPLPATLPPLLGTVPLGAPAAPPANFDELMPRVTAAVAAGTLPEGALLAACTARQLPSLVALTARPDFVAVIWNDMRTQYPALV